MSMTVREARTINTLLAWLTGTLRTSGAVLTVDGTHVLNEPDVLASVSWLADRAHAAQDSGFTGADLQKHWQPDPRRALEYTRITHQQMLEGHLTTTNAMAQIGWILEGDDTDV